MGWRIATTRSVMQTLTGSLPGLSSAQSLQDSADIGPITPTCLHWPIRCIPRKPGFLADSTHAPPSRNLAYAPPPLIGAGHAPSPGTSFSVRSGKAPKAQLFGIHQNSRFPRTSHTEPTFTPLRSNLRPHLSVLQAGFDRLAAPIHCRTPHARINRQHLAHPTLR